MLHGESPFSKSPFSIAPLLGVRTQFGCDAFRGVGVGRKVGNVMLGHGSESGSNVGSAVGSGSVSDVLLDGCSDDALPRIVIGGSVAKESVAVLVPVELP